MNPLIKELASKALKQPDTDNDGLTVFDNDELEKFAELIVKECVGILEPKSRYMGEGPEVLKDKIRQIKQHFGVEE
jgi:hypothetical protein